MTRSRHLGIVGRMAAIGWFALSAELAAQPSAGDRVDAAAASAAIVVGTNAFRQAEGRQRLERQPQLDAAAAAFAEYMARTHRYGHTADGREPSERAQAQGYAYCVIAENIAYQYKSTGFTTDGLAGDFVEGWKNSPEHRHNMLDPVVVEIGAGVAQSSKDGRWFGVQLFGLPRSAQFTFAIVNEGGAPVRYRLGERDFELPPRVTRTHERCRPAELTIEWPGKQSATTVEPRGGERFRLDQERSGSWRLTRQ